MILTEDHTLVGDLVRMKVISPAKVRSHAQRSIFIHALDDEAPKETASGGRLNQVVWRFFSRGRNGAGR